jgi:dolichyl-phosphate beta-glucosyltransferase
MGAAGSQPRTRRNSALASADGPLPSAAMGPRTLLVIPCFRESGRLPGFLPGLCEMLSAARLPVEIQVIDDGSGEIEQSKLASFIESQRVKCAALRPLKTMPINQGKGAAVYHGWDLATVEEFVAFVDADGAVPPAEVARVLALATEPQFAAHALYAVRVVGAGRSVRRTLLRRFTGQVFRSLARFFFTLPVPDTQCGFKVVPTAAYRTVRALLREYRFCFDVELTVCLDRAGVAIISIPIDWAESPGSRVRPATIRNMFFSLLRLRRRLNEP